MTKGILCTICILLFLAAPVAVLAGSQLAPSPATKSVLVAYVCILAIVSIKLETRREPTEQADIDALVRETGPDH